MAEDRELIVNLLKCDVLKIGNYKLKSGKMSPIYIDLRRLIHYPKVMKDLVVAIRTKQTRENLNADTVCGVPYTAIPFASIFSAFYDVPMVMKRKEAKDYGTKKLVEGAFKTGDFCLLIEDVVCSGTSVKDTVDVLRKEGLNVNHCIAVIDKEQGGIANLKKVNLNLYSLFNLETIFNVYCSINRIEYELIEKVTSYLKDNPYMPIYEGTNYSVISYRERAEIISHPMEKRLLQIMDEKKTNLCVTVDTSHCNELIKLVDQLGPHICLLQTHVDILTDFGENIINQLIELSSSHNFLILEDRKFVDTGKTVTQQYKNGTFKIENWADVITVHGTYSSDTIEDLKSSVNTDNRACILVPEISDSFTDEEYKARIFQTVDKHKDFVIGCITRNGRSYLRDKNLICLCQDTTISPSPDSFSKNYKSLEKIIAEGVDIIIIEIGINTVDDIASVIEYKTRSFKAYLDRITCHVV